MDYQKIETLFKKHKTNAYQTSQITGIPPSTFSDWKSGKSKPKIDKIQKLASHFGVPIEYFLPDETKNKVG